MSNAAHISGQNAPFTLPHSPALRGCNPGVVADAPLPHPCTRAQQGDFVLFGSALAATRKPSTMRSMRRVSPWSLPCLSGHTLRGLSCARRHSVFCFGLPPHHATTACWGPRIAPPFGSRFLPEQVCTPRPRTPRKLLPGPSQKAAHRRLGAWPTRSGFANG